MAHVATPKVVAPTPAEDDAAAPAIIAPVSPPTSLPVAWQKAGLTERPRDTHSAPRPEEDASSPTLPEAVDTALKAIERRSSKQSSYDGAPPPVLPSVSSEDLGQAEERAV